MKIEEQVLSREQMKHLQELGVDTSDASMAWYMSPNTNQWKIKVKDKFAHEMLRRISPERYIPTYTTGDLIEKLPKRIGIYHLFIDCDRMQYISWSWQETIFRRYFNFKDKPFINALYDCLCWVEETHKELLKVRND